MSGDTTDEDVLTDERLQAEELPLRLTHPPERPAAYAPFKVEIYDPLGTLKYDDIEINRLTLGFQLIDMIASKLSESSRIRPANYSPPERFSDALDLFFLKENEDKEKVLTQIDPYVTPVSLGITEKNNKIYYRITLSKLKGINPSREGGTRKRKTKKRKTQKRKTRKRKTKKR